MCGCSNNSTSSGAFGNAGAFGTGTRLRYQVISRGFKTYYGSESDAKRHVAKFGGEIRVAQPGQR